MLVKQLREGFVELSVRCPPSGVTRFEKLLAEIRAEEIVTVDESGVSKAIGNFTVQPN